MKTQFVLKMILQFLVDNPYLGGIMEFIMLEDPPKLFPTSRF